MAQNVNGIAKKLYPSEIQYKRVQKELLQLQKLSKKQFKITIVNVFFGLNILVSQYCLQFIQQIEVQPGELKKYSQTQHLNKIEFELFLSSKYPFDNPKLYCRSSFTQPSLSDGRDFLNDILNKDWLKLVFFTFSRSPQLQLKEIVQILPNFIVKVAQAESKNNKQLLSQLGKYHLDNEYYLEEFLNMKDVKTFQGMQTIQGNQEEWF